MKTILIVEPNSLVAEDIAEMIVDHWMAAHPIVVATPAEAIEALRCGQKPEGAILRLREQDAAAKRLLSRLKRFGTGFVLIDDVASPSIDGHTPTALVPGAAYLAQPFTTAEMIAAVERAATMRNGDTPELS